MSLSSILPMEMAVANVSNIMERVISLSSFKKIDPSKVSLLFAKVCVIWKQWDAEHLPGGAILAPKVRARSGVKLVEPVNILR